MSVSGEALEGSVTGNVLELEGGNISLAVAPLLSYRLEDDELRREIPCDNRFTVQALYRLGFRWSVTDDRYLEKTIRMLQTLGFFDVDMETV